MNNVKIGADVQWRINGDSTGAADTNASFPERRAIDRKAVSRTKPAVSRTANYLVFGNAGTMSPIDIDMVGIIGHNLYSAGGGSCDLDIQIADDVDFSVNLLTIASWNGGVEITDDRRLIATNLPMSAPAHRAYRNVQHIRAVFTDAGAGEIFEVGELVLGASHVMRRGPQHPMVYDDRTGADFDVFEPEDGDSSVYVRSHGRWNQPFEFRFTTVAEANPIRSFWDDCAGKAGLLVPRPSSAPNEAYLCSWPPPGLMIAGARNPTHSRYKLLTSERKPFYSSEV